MDASLDLWEPEASRRLGRHELTSVEVTVTYRCNLRCVHCAVGETLAAQDPDRLDLNLLVRRLDEIPALKTLSITGGEPSADMATVQGYILPLLRYARGRGVVTQVNTNLTFSLDRYLLLAPWVDVFHMSWNYTGARDFHRIAWGQGRTGVKPAASERLLRTMAENARALATAGCFVSAESMVNGETAPHLGQMNRELAAMGCRRHEVHPMYPVDWAARLPTLPLAEFRAAIGRFLEERDPDLWVLFGTFPFLPCSPRDEDRALWRKVRTAANATIRNCPDGRSRVNVNAFTGDVFVSDFTDVPAMGNISTEPLRSMFERWQGHEAFSPFNCYCPEAGCTGPSLLVAHMYYPGVDFRERRALV